MSRILAQKWLQCTRHRPNCDGKGTLVGGTGRHLPYKLKAHAGAMTARGWDRATAEAGAAQGHQVLWDPLVLSQALGTSEELSL